MIAEMKEMEADFYELIQNNELIRKIEKEEYSTTDLEYLTEKPYILLAYFQDQIFFWNSNEVIIPDGMIKELADGSGIVSLKNGFYHIVKKTISARERGRQQGEMKIIGLQLIQYNYTSENKYLTNRLNPDFNLSTGLKVTENSTIKGDKIQLSDSATPLYLYFDNNHSATVFHYVWLCMLIIGFFGVLLFLTLLANLLYEKYGEWSGFLFLLTCFAAIGYAIIQYYIPLSLNIFPLFVPEDDAIPFYLHSVGSLLFAVLLILWLIVFFYKKINIQLHSDYIYPKKTGIYVGLLSVLLIYTFFVFYLIRVLVFSFNISFDITSFIYLEFKTIVGAVVLMLLLASFFLVCKKAAKIANQLGLSIQQKILGFGIVTLLYIGYIKFGITFEQYHLYVIFWLAIFSVFLNKFLNTLSREKELKQMLMWVFIFSAFTALLLHSLSMEKEEETRKEIVEQVITEEDNIAEFMFEDAAEQIMLHDKVIWFYYQNMLLSEKELKERILRRHFGGSFNRYKIDIQAYKQGGHSLKYTDKTVSLEDYEGRMKFQKKTKAPYLSLIPNSTTGGYNYLAKLPIFGEGLVALGYLIIEMEKKSDKENVYPELIIEDKFREPVEYDKYSYAVYKDKKLLTHKGDFAYDYRQDTVFVCGLNELKKVKIDGYTHYIKKSEGEKTIVVSQISEGIMDYLSMFSHLFLISGIGVLLFSFILYFIRHSKQMRFRDLFYSSLRMRINVAMLSILLFSFIAIAVVSILYFYQKTTNYHQEILLQKQNEVLTSIENTLQKDANRRFDSFTNVSEWNSRVDALAGIHSMDINLFDKHGHLLQSSQNAIFEKQLRAPQMNPVAFHQMSQEFKSQFIHHEQIGKLSYLSSYVPIKNEKGSVVGFLNLPYFAKEKELRSEISAFLVTLINVYVIIWLIAAVIALAIANSITNPLKMISDKLKNIRLGQQNDLLEWPDNDEIGTLVTQYNETILELDKSAKKLAKNEREYAWRQMAKQVAHEIKNPLTPMKLSIQHLQRAIKDNRPNVGALMDRVSRTLVEQIDTLSRIATEFSSFAQMPTPINELMNINEVIENTVNLYEDTANVRLFKLMPEELCYVNADKDQLIRVFNNLVKNAIQAIPDEKQGIIVVNVKKTKNSVVIGVADNGCGIDAEKKEKVFVPNFTTKSSGMGLGLAMSKNIVEAAKGRIWFESKVDEGTTFYVKLPLEETEEPTYKMAFGSSYPSDDDEFEDIE